MTNEEWANLKERLDMLEAEIQAAAHREFFQEDCKCECKCKPHRMTVQELLDIMDLETKVDLAVDGYHLAGTVEVLEENLNEKAMEATVCSISAGPLRIDVIAATGCCEEEDDG